jgi:RHS repeat-associated protein
LPFGEEIQAERGRTGIGGYGTDLGLRQKFTGKLRDSETTYDYFGARYYSGAQGRFTSVDPAFNWREHVVDPQQWNRYAYVRNNPLRFVDPNGFEIKYANVQLQTFFTFLAARSDAVRATLALYAGPSNPDLRISVADLGTDGADGELAGDFTPFPIRTFTMDDPPGSGNVPWFGKLSDAEVLEGRDNGTLLTSVSFEGGTLRLSTKLVSCPNGSRTNSRSHVC